MNLRQLALRLNPWQTMLVLMSILALAGIFSLGHPLVCIEILTVSLGVGVALDFALHKLQKTTLRSGDFPQSGVITGLIVAVLMPVGIALWAVALAAALAILSKHFVRFSKGHIFNPASFGTSAIVALGFGHALGWWPDHYIYLVIALGLYNLWRVRKYYQAAGFLVGYLIFLVVAKTGSPLALVSYPWFFAMFMVPEPVTSLRGKWQEPLFGAVVALAAIVYVYPPIPAIQIAALPLGLMTANALRFTII